MAAPRGGRMGLQHTYADRVFHVPTPEAPLEAALHLPAQPVGIAILAEEEKRRTPNLTAVTEELHSTRVGTLRLKLLEEGEDSLDLHFDSWRLARRLIAATDWLATQESTRRLPV